MIRFGRSIFKMMLLVGFIAACALELLVRRPASRTQRASWLHRRGGQLLRLVGIAVAQQDRFPQEGVLITNHQGYLDILALAALHPCVFVSKAEIRSWPILGWIVTLAGTIYVERGRGGSAIRARSEMHSVPGVPIVFFPEGTSTNGEVLLPFHSGLLANALAASQPVTAAYIHYSLTHDNGPKVSIANTVAYWDDTPLFLHIFRVLGLRGIHIDIRFAPTPIQFTVGASQRKLAAEQARTAVLQLSSHSHPACTARE